MFKTNPRFAQELAKQPGFRRQLLKHAETAARYADDFARKAGAPWMKRPGARNTVIAEDDGTEVRVVNTDFGGHLQEFGGAKNPPHAPLRRGVRAAGLALRENQK